MKKKWLIGAAVVIMLALVSFGTVYAQEEPGYPVETETPTESPTETETPVETEVPTETDAPTETESPTDSVEPSETETPMPTPRIDSPVCNGTRVHPVLDRLSTRYGAAYEDIVGYYCSSELGVGEIALALAIVQELDGGVDLQALFSQRLDGNMGWGEIKQSLGLIGNGNNNGNTDLKKNQDRNTHQDQIGNEGEDELIQNESNYTEQKGKLLVTPPGLEDKDVGNPTSPPGQEGREPAKEKDNNGIGNDPGANPGHSGNKPGNGPKP